MELINDWYERIDEYYLTDVGFLFGSQTKCSILMDNSPQHKIVHFFKMNFVDDMVSNFSAVDEFGAEKFCVTSVPPTNPGCEKYVITQAENQLGGFELAMNWDEMQEIQHEVDESDETLYQLFVDKMNGLPSFRFETSQNNRVCIMSIIHNGVLHIRIDRTLTENKIITLFSMGVIFTQWRLTRTRPIPNLRISNLQIDPDAKTPLNETSLRTSFKNLCSTRKIFIRPAGRNSRKNVVYHDVYDSTFTVHATIEVTPVKDYQGYAKMVIKDSIGKHIHTAIHFPKQMLTAIYNGQKSLTGYWIGGAFYDYNQIRIFETQKREHINPERVGVMRTGYILYVETSNRFTVADEYVHLSGTRIIHLGRCSSPRFVRLTGILFQSMSQQLKTELYERPIPEIEYYYAKSKPSTRSFIN